MPPRQRHSACWLPTTGLARLKPLAPPPRPQQKWKCLKVRLIIPDTVFSRQSNAAPLVNAAAGDGVAGWFYAALCSFCKAK
ncbi:hypothetical protein D3C78_1900630 [compost metagenome]